MSLIPQSYIQDLKKIPEDRPVAIFMRHAERFSIEKGVLGLEVPLTENGRKSAFELGEKYIKNRLVAAFSSPVERCVDTANNIIKGAKKDIKVIEDPILGGKEYFMNDMMLFRYSYMKDGMPAILDRVFEREYVDGVNDTRKSVPKVIKHILNNTKIEGITLFLTHDGFISFVAGEIFRHRTTPEDWPNFMEPIFIWKDGDNVKLLFRGKIKTILYDSLEKK